MESEHKVLQNKIEELLNIINTQSEKGVSDFDKKLWTSHIFATNRK